MITLEDFKNSQLRIGKIIKTERVESSDKLVRLMVDLGEKELRQIVAGIGKKYDPVDLEGKEIVVVANLEPKEIKGIQSQGMLLATLDNAGEPIILIPEKTVPPGSEVR